MDALNRAIVVTEQIIDALRAEVVESRHHRVAIRTLDTTCLLARGQARAMFTAHLEELQATLAGELASAGQALRLPEVTVDGLRRFAPAQGQRLADGFARVRTLAGSLKELDVLNQMLASRALACVRGYTRALVGPPAAYDRRGQSTSRSTLSTSSRRA
jgi:hypothetical protein